MNVERLVDIIHKLEEIDLPLEEQEEIVHYLRHSLPGEAYSKLASSVLELVQMCEIAEEHHLLTHEVRNQLAVVAGYQVLELV